MIPVVAPADMRRVDDRAVHGGVSIESLIERAGWAVARVAREMLGGTYGRRVLVVAGPGNNGADGRSAARFLRERGVAVRVLAVDELPDTLPDADLIVDAAFGTGFRGVWSPPPATCPVLAVDVPSGIDGLTGIAHGSPWTCERTVTFVAPKPGHFFHDGRRSSGRLDVIDIGIGLVAADSNVGLVTGDDVEQWWPRREIGAHKWNHAAFVVAGSAGMTGAAALAASAAMRSGAGIVHLVTPGSNVDSDVPTEIVRRAVDSTSWANDVVAMAESRFKALAIGPGLGRAETTLADVRQVVERTHVPIVIDGDALHAVDTETLSRRSVPVILTPHDGEFTSLTGAPPSADRIASARSLAEHSRSIVLLKGSTTVVADPSGRVALMAHGDERLATAGSGDVLTGVITGALAAGVAPFEAAVSAAWICAEAGRHCPRHGTVASDLVHAIPTVFDGLFGSTGQNDRR